MALFIVSLTIPVVDGRTGQQIGNVWFPFDAGPDVNSVSEFDAVLTRKGRIVGVQYDRTKRDDPRGRGYVKDWIILGQEGLLNVKLSSERRRAEFEGQVLADLTGTPYADRDEEHVG